MLHTRYRLARGPRTTSSGSKCLAAQCSSPGTMIFTTGTPTSDLVRSTAMTCSRPTDCSWYDMKRMSSRMSWLRYVSTASNRLQRTVGEPQTLRRPVRVAVSHGDLVDVFPHPLKNRQPALSQLGERPRHRHSRVRMGAKAAVEMGSANAGRFPTRGNERRHPDVARDVADDQPNTSRHKLPGKTRRHVRKRTDVDDRKQLAVGACVVYV